MIDSEVYRDHDPSVGLKLIIIELLVIDLNKAEAISRSQLYILILKVSKRFHQIYISFLNSFGVDCHEETIVYKLLDDA